MCVAPSLFVLRSSVRFLGNRQGNICSRLTTQTRPAMQRGVVLLVSLLFVAHRIFCFVDDCSSLSPMGPRTETRNLTLNYSVVAPITDKFRYSRSVSDDGYVQYVSEVGFEAVTIVGYAYEPEGIDTDWRLDIRTGYRPGRPLPTTFTLNSSNVERYRQPWPTPPETNTNFVKFKLTVDAALEDCPKVEIALWSRPYYGLQVVELWFRGNASGNGFFGWGLQVGRVRLEESLFEQCTIPACLNRGPASCFSSLSALSRLQKTRDDGEDFSKVYIASDNIVRDARNALAHFNGDTSRFRRQTNEKGILTYSIPQGIASMEVTLYRCERNRTQFYIRPYIDPQCKPLRLSPSLKDDSYYSNCWRRYRTTIDFRDMLDCPPSFVDLVIEGHQAESLQISSVVLRGYGAPVQDPIYAQSVAASNRALRDSEETGEESDEESEVQMKYWLPALIVGSFFVIVTCVGVLLFRNAEVRDFIADYIEDNFPFIYKHIYPPDPPKAPTPRVHTGMHSHYNNRSYPSESINFSCTFDGNLKKTREPPASRDVTATRDGLGEQLIDLSKHLHKSFWTSKVGRKTRVLEIEERLGKGGFGRVWKARWQGTPVALKVVPLHATLKQEEKLARMAIMEAALSGCLAHPNIVSTYTCEIREATELENDKEAQSVEDSQNKQHWVSIERFAQTYASKSFMKSQAKNDLEVRIIMEYCDRGSLVAAIARGWFRRADDPSQPDFEAVLLTALDIARGLCCLHENNIIHGDLKPHNVLLQNKPFVDSRGFIAKIADFGLSIKMESEQSHVDGMRMGTGGYVSPEVAVRGKILPASDIYSFGILLWELFTGELIQDAIKGAPKVSSKLTMGSWRPIFEGDCPQAYSRLACMCWNDFPDWRPTLDYIIDELNAMLKTELTSMEAVEPPLEEAETTAAPTISLT